MDAQSKKTAVNEALLHSITAQEWAARYEQLRSDALHEAPVFLAASGLQFFSAKD
jgi:hypothetical protein